MKGQPMASLLDSAQERPAPIEQRARNKLTVTQKRWLLSAHLLCMAAWLGGFLCSLVLNSIALSTTDPRLLNASYVFADILDISIVRGGAAGSLITGILLAVLTQWGLVRFYWIIAKEIAAIVCVVADQIIIRWNQSAIALTATQGLGAASNPVYLNVRTLLLIGLLLRLLVLLAVIVISIFKPWGQRKRAAQSSAQRFPTEA